MVAWTDRYSVGNDEIDKQHKKLFELITNVNAMTTMGMTPEVSRVLDELVEYTKNHFSYEEMLIFNAKYPEAKEHKEKHTKFLNDIKEFQNKVKRKEPVSIMTIMRFLNMWLVDHVLKEDMAYKKYIQKKD